MTWPDERAAGSKTDSKARIDGITDSEQITNDRRHWPEQLPTLQMQHDLIQMRSGITAAANQGVRGVRHCPAALFRVIL